MENDNCTQRLFLGGKKDSLLGSRELYTLITKFPRHCFYASAKAIRYSVNIASEFTVTEHPLINLYFDKTLC